MITRMIYLRLFRAFGEKSPSTEAWRTLIPFSSDFCYAITDLQDQKESPLHPIEPCGWRAQPKRAKGISSEEFPWANGACLASLAARTDAKRADAAKESLHDHTSFS